MADPEPEQEPRQNRFEFDTVLPCQASQEQVFEVLTPLLRSSLDGCSACIFAYGQVCSVCILMCSTLRQALNQPA